MPSSITHAYFGMDIYERLEKNKQQKLFYYKDYLKVFAQGPDVFLFYNLLTFKKGKHIRWLGSYMQKNKTQKFFINLLNAIKKRKLADDPEVITFLYGFIAHYVLDMTIHPYIVYKTGIYNKHDKSTYKYLGKHEEIEAYIDTYFMYVRGKTRPRHFKSHIFCLDKTNVSNNLKDVINEVFIQTFNEQDIANIYVSSIKQMKLLYKWLRYDSTGIKKKIYRFCNFLPFSFKLETISFDTKLNNNNYYLNLDKDYWYHPLDKEKTYNYSFIELYAIALHKTLDLIKEVDNFLYNKKTSIQAEKMFPNLSYLTGYECELGSGTYFSF